MQVDVRGEGLTTICTHGRDCLFGRVVDGEMQLNALGEIARAEWELTGRLRPEIELGPYGIMPNHFHGIIWMIDDRRGTARRAPTDARHIPTDIARRAPTDIARHIPTDIARRAPTDAGRTPTDIARRAPTTTHEQFGKPVAGSIPTIVRAFKSAVTRQINQVRQTPGAPVWQRNDYEHIIRDERSWQNIAAYILNNPRQWELDQLFKAAGLH